MNKSWRQHPTRNQLYSHLPPIMKTIQVRRSRYAGHCWRSRDELIRDVLLWTPLMVMQKQDDQHEHAFRSYVRVRDVVLKTCLGQWTIGRSGVRGSGISVLPARHDDDDQFQSISYISFQGICYLFMIDLCLSFYLYSSVHLPVAFFVSGGGGPHGVMVKAMDCGIFKGARGVMVIIVGNGHGDPSSNPGLG